MFDEDQLRELSQAERLSLIRALAALEHPPAAALGPGPRRRVVALGVIVVCCLVLAAWIGILAVSLPLYYRSGGWRGAWVGFDVALLAAFAATGWAAWQRRQILIVCLIVLATLLCCDAWFDVVLDAQTKGFELSLLTALFIELPLAALAANGARRLLRATIATARPFTGEPGPVSLRQVRLLATLPGAQLTDLFTDPRPARDPEPAGPPAPAAAEARASAPAPAGSSAPAAKARAAGPCASAGSRPAATEGRASVAGPVPGPARSAAPPDPAASAGTPDPVTPAGPLLPPTAAPPGAARSAGSTAAPPQAGTASPGRAANCAG